MAFSPTLSELREQVDACLERFLARKSDEIPEGEPLIDEIGRLHRLGGKRLRPAFCYWGYRAPGGVDRPEIVAGASSLELLHTFALVHDDIMDSADLRRGEKTTRAAHGDNFALLTGDLALVLADSLLMECGFPPEVIHRGFAIYSRMRGEVIAGQYLDVRVAEQPDATERQVRRIAMLKSGLYSVVEPLTIGAVLAGASMEVVEGLRAMGRPVGEAFQLRDDLLGVFGDSAVLGKSVDSDIREGKKTLLYVKAMKRASETDRGFLLDRWGGADLATEEVEKLRRIIGRSGAREEIEDLLVDLRAQAAKALASLAIEEEAREALGHLIEVVIDRDA